MATVTQADGGTASPYVGFRPFADEDRPRFFGRIRESREIAALWQANKLTVLHGPSGVGKTSLLQAGIIPLLDPECADVIPAGRVSQASVFPLAALPEHNPYTFALLSAWSPVEAPQRLVGLTIRGFLSRRGERTDRYGDPIPVLVAIDQAEEMFSGVLHRQSFRERFIDELAEALDENPGLRLLLSIRADYLAAVLPYERRLGGGSRARFQLRPFHPQAALEAVRKPLETTNCSFETGAAELLVDNLRTVTLTSRTGDTSTVTVDTVEPVQLQVVCAEMWESLPSDVRIITAEQVLRHADIDRSLADFCSRALAAVASEYGLNVPELTSWLRRTFITDLGTRGTVYEGLTVTAAMPNAVVHALEDKFILHAELRSGSRWYELSHDRLIEPIRKAEDAAADTIAPDIRSSPIEYLRAAEAAFADGQMAVALRQAEAALRECSEHDLRVRAEIESFLGNVAHEQSELQAAIVHYREAAALFEIISDRAAVGQLLAAIGRLLLQEGRQFEALEELRAAASRLPNDLTVQTELGRTLWHMGRWHAAVAMLSNVLAADSRNPGALLARGEILAEQGDPQLALADLDQVHGRPLAASQAATALALARLGRLDEAQRRATEALAIAPSSGPVLLYAARVSELSGDPAGAALLAQRALAAADPVLLPHQHAEAATLA